MTLKSFILENFKLFVLCLLIVGNTIWGLYALFSNQFRQVSKVTTVSYDQEIAACKKAVSLASCWADLIDKNLKESGLDSAFAVFSQLYANEPQFASNCHDYTHTLGQEAYLEYLAGKDFNLTTKTAYCGYGFYHGFMESLLIKTKDPKKAVEFCTFVEVKLKKETSDARGACFHGIGHGSVDGSDTRAWGDPQKVIQPGLNLCEKVSQTQDELYRCVTGAYNSIEILSANPKYQLTYFRNNSFDFCKSQPDSYLEACYTNMLPAQMDINSSDFPKIASLIEAIPEKDNAYTVRGMVMNSLFHEYYHYNFNLNLENYTQKGLNTCRNLDSRSHLPCVEGLAGGLMKYGEPEKEYIRALDFCGQDLLNLDEQDVCYKRNLSTLGVWYKNEKIRTICLSVPEVYRNYCSY